MYNYILLNIIIFNNQVFTQQIHGRSREARYTKAADWSYVDKCAQHASPMPVFGNGDVLTMHDYYDVIDNTSIDGVMIGRFVVVLMFIK